MNKKLREVTDSFLCNGSSQKKKKKSHLKFIIYYLKARPDIDSLRHCTVPNYSEYLILEMYHIYQNVRIYTSETSSNLGKKRKKSKKKNSQNAPCV